MNAHESCNVGVAFLFFSMIRRVIAKFLHGSFSPAVDVAAVGIVAFVGCVAVGLVLGIPKPEVHDEFSYLLAADTFARGKVTNPTHPMWVHFETMHVIHQPSYMSKFMPGQGLVLALGKVVGGHPIVGVWLSMAFMCATICWMLQAWVPRRWAILGGVFAAIHPYLGIGGYWAQSYWGSAVAATGGALLIGGARRLVRQPRIPYAIATGIALAILANSRPYEGLVLSLPIGVWSLFCLRTNGFDIQTIVRRILFPLSLLGAITLSAMAYYNYRITGNMLRLPYLVHEQMYSVSPLFTWEKPIQAQPVYRHDLIREFHEKFEAPVYRAKQSLAGFFKINFAVLILFVSLGLNVFVIPLICSFRWVPWAWKNRWGRFALLTYGIFILGLMIEVHNMLHYWAPITALTYFFVIQSIRLWRVRDPLVGRLVPAVLVSLAVTVWAVNSYRSILTRDDLAPPLQRANLLAELNQKDDRYLILVKYGPKHSYHYEWVFNEADIDGSKVVWARHMDLKQNCRLIDYFKDRRIWLLEIDRDTLPVKLNPFPKERCQS